jgi:single-strand DNA-binding protein
MNLVILKGRLGGNPEAVPNKAGLKICTMSVAEGRGDKVQWHRITAFGQVADAAIRYLSKGREVLVQGHLEIRKYEKDGQTRYSTSVIADRIEFCGSGGGTKASAEEPESGDVETADF